MATIFLLLIALAALLLARVVFSPLRRYPGPWLASITNAWRFQDVIRGMSRVPSPVALHQQYGDIVRIGPKHLSFAKREAIRDIYGVDKAFPKSKLYWTAAPVAHGRVAQTLFSSTDVQWHDSLRSTIQHVFKPSEVAKGEAAIDEVIAVLIAQLDSRFTNRHGSEGVVDLAMWMSFFTFDALGKLTYGTEFGALQRASDIEGMMAKTHQLQTYTVIIGQWPVLDKLFAKNPVTLWLQRRGLIKPRPSPFVRWATQWQDKHQADGNSARHSLLTSFLDAKKLYPDKLTDAHCISLGVSMVVAGSESTAIALTALLYFVLKDRKIYERLQKEVDQTFEVAATADQIPWKIARELPYLDACVKESFRMHPTPRFAHERVLPPEGATISGEAIPGGTVVSVHPWVMSRQSEIYGDNVDAFSPDRWLPTVGSDPADESKRIRRMQGALLHFGQGRYSCIGKDISLMEIYKLVPVLLRRYDIALADPSKTWRFEVGGFVNVGGVEILLISRDNIMAK